MRLRTIRRRLQHDGVSKKSIQNIHSKMFGLSDEETLPGKKNHKEWLKAISSVKKQQRYFRGLQYKKHHDFDANSFINN